MNRKKRVCEKKKKHERNFNCVWLPPRRQTDIEKYPNVRCGLKPLEAVL